MSLLRYSTYLLLLASSLCILSCTEDEKEENGVTTPPPTDFDFTLTYGGDLQNYGQNFDFDTSTSFIVVQDNEELLDAIEDRIESILINTTYSSYTIDEILLDQVRLDMNGIYPDNTEVTDSEIRLQKNIGLGEYEETTLAVMDFFDYSESEVVYSLTQEDLKEAIEADPERIFIQFTFDSFPFEFGECTPVLTFDVRGTSSE